MLYAAFLVAHSTLRWVVLILGLVAIVRGVAGWSGRPWTAGDARTGKLFVSALDLQFLIGLILFAVLSPVVREAFQDIGAAMRDGRLRFFLVEHVIGMLIGVALAHIGNVRIKKAGASPANHKTAAVFYGLAIVVILLSIPWPGMSGGRPLLTWF
jgi:hypothetical protein